MVFLEMDYVVPRYEAVRLNRLVYAHEDFRHGRFYSRVLREYLDFLPILEVQRESYKRRLERA